MKQKKGGLDTFKLGMLILGIATLLFVFFLIRGIESSSLDIIKGLK